MPASGAALVILGGELDLFSAPQLEEALDRASSLGTATVVDLCDCAFLDSTGLNVLLRARGAALAAGRRFLVACRPGSAPDRLLDVAVRGLFEQHASRDEALGAVAARAA